MTHTVPIRVDGASDDSGLDGDAASGSTS